jgi:ATP:corrinoid adenosyltransferase
LSHGSLPLEDVLHTLQNRPNDVHVVLTGQHCPPELIALADTVTEMTNRKGPGSSGSLPSPVVPDNPAERDLTGGGDLDVV